MPDYGVSWWAGDSPWFHLNKQIKSVVISEGITYIGNGAFGDEFGYGQYEQLTSISLPSTLKGVGVFAFRGAPLKSVNLPDGLQTIKRAAFSDTLLTTVHIPASVSELDENDGGWFAFDCDTLHPSLLTRLVLILSLRMASFTPKGKPALCIFQLPIISLHIQSHLRCNRPLTLMISTTAIV